MTETIRRSRTEARSMVATGLSPTRSQSTSSRTTAADADGGGNDASSTKPAEAATTDVPAATRAAATAATQQAARAKATSQGSALAASFAARFEARPPEAEPTTYEGKLAAYNLAHGAYTKLVDDYWSNMKSARQAGGYVKEQPPGPYAGPAKPVDPNAPPATGTPAKPTSTIPVKQAFLDQAKAVYGFTPEQADEATFKKQYAKEAVARGFNSEQVAKVYAFETGGNGLADDQPIRKDGTAISTALGYTQILNATTVELMQKHGDAWAKELDAAGKHDKADVVRKMTADAKTAGTSDDDFQKFAKTPAGRAIHSACLDVDIGSKLQAQNLKDITDTAARLGVTNMKPAELELLNLAGETNGARMLKPELKDLPTSNFFTRAGYEANPVVRNRTGAQLLHKIDDDMNELVQKPGAQQLIAAFSSL